MTDVYVRSGLPLVQALKKNKLKMGRDFTTKKSAPEDLRQDQIILSFYDHNKALMFKLAYGGGE